MAKKIDVDVIKTAKGDKKRKHSSIINELAEHKLKLGKEVILVCSACGTKLATIQVTRPEHEGVYKFQAKCWKCEDSSFVAEVKGGIHLGNTRDSVITNIDTKLDGISTLYTVKNPDPNKYEG